MTRGKRRLGQSVQGTVRRIRAWLEARPAPAALDDDEIAFAMLAPEIAPIASVDLLGELRQAWQEIHRRT
jgi:hypothetical protein